jgi:hypothetical protein
MLVTGKIRGGAPRVGCAAIAAARSPCSLTEEPMDTAHAASDAGKPLPPGSLGLPWIGETLAFVQDSFAFFAERRKSMGLSSRPGS